MTAARMLFADRFLMVSDAEAIDVATGRRTWIRPMAFDDRASLESWLVHCSTLLELVHPGLVPLADFGPAGRAGYFEAWECPAPHRGWRARDAATAEALASAVGLLLSHDLVVGRLHWTRVVDAGGRPGLLPFWEESGPEGPAEGLARLVESCIGRSAMPPRRRARPGPARDGAQTIAAGLRETASLLAEVLDTAASGHPRAVTLPAARSAEARDALVRALARCARLRGYIPLSAGLEGGARQDGLPEGWRACLDERHLLVIAGGAATRADGATFLLRLALASDRAHVLVRFEQPPLRVVPGGWRSRSSTLRVCEQQIDYAGSTRRPASWPGSFGDLGLRGGRGLAIAQAADRGRHAQVERWLRDVVGRSARRADDPTAGEAGLSLGRLLLMRGQWPEAWRSFDAARQHFERAGLGDWAVRAGALCGLAWTDGGRFREAEGVLRAAVIAASELGDEPSGASAALGLARCLLWQGRVDEALDALARVPAAARQATPADEPVLAEWRRLGEAGCAREKLHATVPPRAGLISLDWSIGVVDPGLVHACLLGRAALVVGDLATAGRAAADARVRAERSGRPLALASACRVRAALASALGDVPAMREHVEAGLDAARRGHDPLRALRLRVLCADALRRDGHEAEARVLIARLARLDASRLPAVVSAPLVGLLSGALGHPGAVVSMAASVAPAVSRDAPPASRNPARSVLADAIVEVVNVCQAADDEREVLRKIAATLRHRLRAVSVACYGCEEESVFLVLRDGSEHHAEATAQRAIEAGQVIPPAATRSGLEAAMSVRFAGKVIGAMACRWMADIPPDWAHAGPVLAAATAAAAPCLRSVIDRRAAPPGEVEPGEIVGVSEAVRRLRQEIQRAALAPFNVVIEGESGSGKELVARAIHRLGPRRHRPLCAVNCAALTDELLEAELFGHARGAFTGAVAERKGLFEEAHQGILVLDEVGELSPRGQAKLLRAIQEGEVRRLGENTPRSVDVRVVAATNRPLRPAVEAGVFRRDLLYRLEVIRIVVPPLHARVEDIPVLAAHFWRSATARLDSRSTLAPATLAALARYDWPGNVRELQNAMAALAVASGWRGSVGPDQLPSALTGQSPSASVSPLNLDDARRGFEARFVRAALARAGGRRAQAAADLGVTRQGLAKLLARLGIE
jgi:DNA-binding NtrC family response regulator/tetratricopeptide (TPR) repeat protein